MIKLLLLYSGLKLGKVLLSGGSMLLALGVPVLVGLFVWRPSPMLLLIAVMAWPQLWKPGSTAATARKGRPTTPSHPP